MRYKSTLVAAVAVIALATAPLTPASAHGYHHGGGLILGLAALGTAAVVGAATIATAPLRILAAPVYAAPPRPAYYAPPGYYAPRYYALAPGYYGR